MSDYLPNLANDRESVKPKLTVIVIIIVTLAWFASSLVFPPNLEVYADEPAPARADISSVAVAKVAHDDLMQTLNLYGTTQANERFDIRAEVTGEVAEILAEEGQWVTIGDKILTIAPRERGLRLSELRARVSQQEIDYKSARNLAQKGLQSQSRVQNALAQLNEARAELKEAQIAVNLGVIRAPASGILESLNVDVGALVGPNIRVGSGAFTDGDSIAMVLDVEPTIVVAYVPEKYHGMVQLGREVTVKTADERTIVGHVKTLASLADEATRTFKVEIEVKQEVGVSHENYIPVGMTAQITLPLQQLKATLVPTSSLTISRDNQLGVKVILPKDQPATGEANKITGQVQFFPAKIVQQGADNQIWVTGLPSPVWLITSGFGYTPDGSYVTGIFDASDAKEVIAPLNDGSGNE